MINLFLDEIQGQNQSLTAEAGAIWDEAHLKALLQISRSSLHLIQAPPWDDWLQQHGGRKAVYAYLLDLESLTEDQRQLLQVILEHPQQTADFYAARLYISRKTYFRSLRKLLPVLEHRLNGWELAPRLPFPLMPTFNVSRPLIIFIARGKESTSLSPSTIRTS